MSEPIIRPITRRDNPGIQQVIQTVMPEFGASGKGFAIHDEEVLDMHSAYTVKGAAYFVIEEAGKIVGGGGVGSLAGGEANTCELKKMYLMPEARGRGLAQKVLDLCLDYAKNFGYEFCYLETFRTMNRAMEFYRKNGFEQISGPMGNTGHFSCDKFFKKPIRASK